MRILPCRWGCCLSALLLAACLGGSGVAETWSYDLTTDGGDVEFVAPAALDSTHAGYRMVYHVEMMNATAILPSLPGWPVTVEVLDRLPPELRDGVKYLAGPPPLVLLQEDAYYPDDVEDPNLAGFRCRITFGMKDDGRAFVSATDNILSIFETSLDPNDPLSPPITIELLSVQMIGTISAEPAPAVLVSLSQVPVAEGGAADASVKLSMAPAADVVVTIASADGDAGIACQMQVLTFTPQNWATPQSITFTAAADDDGDAGQRIFDLTADAAAPASIRVVEIEPDCDTNGLADRAEILAGSTADCNGNLLPDVCEISAGLADCDNNGVPNACEIAAGAADCDANGIPDRCDMAGGAADCDGNGVPDRCQPDRDSDGRIDACDGCPDDAAKFAPGTCGCGIAESACGGTTGPDIGNGESPAQVAPDTPVASPDSSDDPNTDAPSAEPTAPEPDAGDYAGEALSLDDLLAGCGIGMCGVGVVGWLPATFLGLVGVRLVGRRRW